MWGIRRKVGEKIKEISEYSENEGICFRIYSINNSLTQLPKGETKREQSDVFVAATENYFLFPV